MIAAVVVALVAQVALPPPVRQAQRVYLSLEAADMRAMDELAKQWRLLLPDVTLVDQASEADLVVTLRRGPSGEGIGWVAGGVFGESGGQAWHLLARLPDSSFSEPLYSDREVIGDFSVYGGIKKLVQRFRDRRTRR